MGYVYILSNKPEGALYIGVTSNLIKRIYEHRTGVMGGFSRKYHLHNLVYFEVLEEIKDAIAREKQLKNWHRQWKLNLVSEVNPYWRDLYPELVGEKDAETSSA
jgi:putative endonuclease